MKSNEYMNDIIKENEIKLRIIKEQYEKNQKIYQQLTKEKSVISINRELSFYRRIFDILSRIVRNLYLIDNDIFTRKLSMILQSKEEISEEKQYRDNIITILQSVEKGTLKLLSIIEQYSSNSSNELLIKDIMIKIQNNRKVENAKKQRKLLEIQKEEVIKRIVEKKDKIYFLLRGKELSSSFQNKKKLIINRNNSQMSNDYNVNYAYLTSY